MEFFSCQPIVEDTGNLFQKENKILLSIKNSPSLNDLGETNSLQICPSLVTHNVIIGKEVHQ